MIYVKVVKYKWKRLHTAIVEECDGEAVTDEEFVSNNWF